MSSQPPGVADTDTVDTEQTRLAATGLASVDERGTTCCYAKQDKFWVEGAPNGERWEIYTYPVPWKNLNWGNQGENVPDPHRVEFLVVEMATLNLTEGELFAQLRGSGSFDTIMDDGNVVVLRRRQPAPTE